MPRVTRSSAKTSSEDSKTYPYPKTKPEVKTEKNTSKSKPKEAEQDHETKGTTDSHSKPKSSTTKKSAPRTGKDSHLYTDDNPSTTLHGTGFKDADTANHTIALVAKRSLLYQFQTINTMYHRAKHHPHSDNNSDMQAAMSIFRTWLDETYQAAKAAQTDFTPLLRKDVVQRYLPRLRDRGIDTAWAEKYIDLPKGKRMANVLMDETEPGEADMARLRQDVLEGIVVERGGKWPIGKDDPDLWDGHGDGLSSWHLKCIACGWSPVKPDALLSKFESSEKWKAKVS